MRKLVVLLAVAGFAAHANAEAGKSEVTHSGEFRARHFTTDNTENSAQLQQLRFKGGLTFRSGDKFTGQLTLLANDNFGGAAGTPAATAEAAGATALNFNEAYGAWMASDELMIKVGRFGMNFGDGSIISTNDWEQTPYALDGLMLGYDTEFAKFSASAVKHVDLNATNNTVGVDRELRSYILTGELKSLPEFLKTAALHVISTGGAGETTGVGSQTGNYDVLRYGVTLKGDMVGVDYRLVYDMHSGKAKGATDADVNGNMLDAEVGYTLADVMNLRFYFNYHMDSGDADGSYQPFMYYRHYAAGLQDVLGWGNLTYMNIGASLKPMDDLDVMLAYYMFTASDDQVGNVSGAGAALAGRTLGEADLGSEINLSVKKKYGDNFYIWARYSMFDFGKGMGDADTASQYFLEASMTF